MPVTSSSFVVIADRNPKNTMGSWKGCSYVYGPVSFGSRLGCAPSTWS